MSITMESAGKRPIKFQVLDLDEIDGLRSIDICRYGYDASLLLDKDQTVIARDTIRVRFDYPLTTPVIKEFYSKGGFRREQLARLIGGQYRKIYIEEEETSTIPVGRASAACLNRCRTTGIHGIWGHDLSDLSLYSMRRGDDGVYDLGVDS